MKYILRILLVLIAGALGGFIYLNTDHYLAKQSWKYRDGFYIGDWVVFNNGPVELKDRKIYKNGIPVAKVKVYTGRLLLITSMSGDTSGHYVNK